MSLAEIRGLWEQRGKHELNRGTRGLQISNNNDEDVDATQPNNRKHKPERNKIHNHSILAHTFTVQ
jgi:hypothetical protein